MKLIATRQTLRATGRLHTLQALVDLPAKHQTLRAAVELDALRALIKTVDQRILWPILTV